MTGERRFEPSELSDGATSAEELAEATAMANLLGRARDVAPTAGPDGGFVDRVMASIATEPLPAPAVAARRAIAERRPVGVLVALRDALRVVAAMRWPAFVRLQAAPLAALALLMVVGGTALVGVGASRLLSSPAPTPLPLPSVAPAPTSSPGPTVAPRPAVTPANSTAPTRTATPTETVAPPATDSPEPSNSGPAATERATPRATRTPRPTETVRPAETPRPTPTLRPGETPKPTSSNSGPGGGGSGSSGSGSNSGSGSSGGTSGSGG
jgi:uncharacterized membrane protein YgcG